MLRSGTFPIISFSAVVNTSLLSCQATGSDGNWEIPPEKWL
jgi:hypothetical protein